MNNEEFADALNRWGSDLAQWPPAQRAAGQVLLAGSRRAGELLAEARQLDTWLGDAADHLAPLDLQRRILHRLPPTADFAQRAVDWLSATLWRPALGAACMLLVGFAVGVVQPEPADDGMLDEVSLLVFSADYEELDVE